MNDETFAALWLSEVPKVVAEHQRQLAEIRRMRMSDGLTFWFATCERGRALCFLQRLYPSRTISDEGKTKVVLDFVEADIIRIPDPMVHGMRVAILHSKNWDESRRDEVYNALKAFHEED